MDLMEGKASQEKSESSVIRGNLVLPGDLV
jgi:hypothetical protein